MTPKRIQGNPLPIINPKIRCEPKFCAHPFIEPLASRVLAHGWNALKPWGIQFSFPQNRLAFWVEFPSEISSANRSAALAALFRIQHRAENNDR